MDFHICVHNRRNKKSCAKYEILLIPTAGRELELFDNRYIMFDHGEEGKSNNIHKRRNAEGTIWKMKDCYTQRLSAACPPSNPTEASWRASVWHIFISHLGSGGTVPNLQDLWLVSKVTGQIPEPEHRLRELVFSFSQPKPPRTLS